MRALPSDDVAHEFNISKVVGNEVWLIQCGMDSMGRGESCYGGSIKEKDTE